MSSKVEVLSPPPHLQENFHNTMCNYTLLYACIIIMYEYTPFVKVFDETVSCTVDTSL